MSANTFPAKIEPFKWAEQGYTWSGTLPLSRFVRIAREAVGSIENQLIQHRLQAINGCISSNSMVECKR
jgi:uncharacterized protein